MMTAEEVCREYRRQVYSLARRWVGSEADAEDVCQEVFVRIVRKLDTFRAQATVRTWLHRITVNAALNLRRQHQRRRECPLCQDLVCPPVCRSEQAERQEALRRTIEGLPEKYRSVLLADLEGRSYAAIGERLGLSVPCVKSRLHRAKTLVRETLCNCN